MTHLLHLYRAQFKTTIAEQLQYRGALAIWMLGLVLEPVIYLSVWSTVARSQGGDVDGFTAASFAAYFIVVMIVDHATFTWVIWQFEFWVREGNLSPLLLRPVHPVHREIAVNLTFKLLTLVVVVPVAAVLVVVFRPNFSGVEPWGVAAFVVALGLAIALRYAIEWTLALLAFWTTRVTAINKLYIVAFLFLSGQAVPIALLPGPARTLAEWLPFYRVLGFPVELLLGRLTPRDAAVGIAAQVVWIAVIWLAMERVWSRGVRQYSAVGA